MNLNLPKGKEIILFDGDCNFCNWAVNYVIKHDKKDIFRFCSINSPTGKNIIDYLKIDTSKTDSVIVYTPNIAYYVKTNAVFIIAERLSGIHLLLLIFKLFPDAVNNFIYDFIAKRRRLLMSKKSNCILPTEAIKTKFLL
jgi:predicted DCC family thiol-disulfide oxidoreductase YuxK